MIDVSWRAEASRLAVEAHVKNPAEDYNADDVVATATTFAAFLDQPGTAGKQRRRN